jgi:tRNA(Ile)-lysidine synthase
VDEFVRRVEEAIVRRRLLRDGDAVLVAVSGGLDSMVLLRTLHSLAAKHRWVLAVAHFNHLLRGRAADADLRFVERETRKLGIRFESASDDVRAFAKAQKLSIEMAARTLRHQFFARTAREAGISRVALAHHADDQIELFLLRLLRGASSGGLAGMHWTANSPADARIKLIRPLLHVRKSELAEWAKQNKIAFREDATNASTNILRNRIRHKLLPLLRREYQPGIDSVLLRESELLRDENDFMAQEALRAARSRKNFDQISVALQRRVLRSELLRAGISPDFQLIEQLRHNVGVWTQVGARFCRRDKRGRIETKSNTSPDFQNGELRIDLNDFISAQFEGATVSWLKRKRATLAKPASGREFFDAEAIGNTVLLRHWRAGDRFQPIGMKSLVKLQDLFTNQKIPRERRHKLVVATTESGEIFWVEDLRIGERFKVTASTKQRLEWRWRRF